MRNSIIAALVGLATWAGATDYFNVTTGVGPTGNLPADYREAGIFGAQWPDHVARGWRIVVAAEAPAAGLTVTGRSYAQAADADKADEVLTTRATAEMQAESAAARVADFLTNHGQSAYMFRAMLRRYFGEGAETNRNVTAAAVTAYFKDKADAETITAVEAVHAPFLKGLFDELAAWNGTGETWTCPWEALPE